MIGPLPITKAGNKYIVTMIDYCSVSGQKQQHLQTSQQKVLLTSSFVLVAGKILQLVNYSNRVTVVTPNPCMSCDISTLMFILYCYLLVKRFGFPSVLISDQGREFINKINEEFMTLAGRCMHN